MTPFKTFHDGSTIAFGKGKFDDFCIYFTQPDGKVWFPLDREYFQSLARVGDEHRHGRWQVYSDFCCVYDSTTKDVDPEVLTNITRLSLLGGYGNNSLIFDVNMSVVYAGMVAEENKADTKLGKRIKRLGMHQVMHHELSPRAAADFSRGMRWFDINRECKKRGF